ncbi:MAG: phosphoribosylamine--glycine ligase [Saprospiraceae bacterium]|nr:phosphoribosylamine--glycine ligase [Saprospiraceae bacterium]
MKVLLLGSGGREHALALGLSKGRDLETLYIAPGNPGTEQLGTNVKLDMGDFHQVEAFVLEKGIDMIVVGPEAPLVAGIADHFKKHSHIQVIGPSAQGAQLEGSKAFSKKFMQRHQIPTAGYFECDATNLQQGIDFLRSMPGPYVLKADGLAAGKGVLIIDDIKEAEEALTEMLNGMFGEASATVVIEEFLSGIEFSVFALTNGKQYVLLPEAKDYKRIGEGDQGLNTGGMGAVSPVPFVDDHMKQLVEERIVKPTVAGLAAEEIDYQGFIFFGLIKVNGAPYVIEYNCRMGDPETEVVFPRISSDVLEMMKACADHQLDQYQLQVNPQTAVTVMMVSGGYPGDYEKGKEINIEYQGDSMVFHAGTSMKEGKLVTSGGRVLAVTSFANSIEAAAGASYKAIDEIYFEGAYYRRDIGGDLINKPSA